MAKGSIRIDKEVERLRAVRLPVGERCTTIINGPDKGKRHICSRSDGELCNVYAFPKTKWLNGDCPMCDAELKTLTEAQQAEKVRVGQQKQKKKSRR